MKRKGYILLMGLSVMLLFSGCGGDSRVQIVEPKEAVKGNPGETDTRTVREQVQAPGELKVTCQSPSVTVSVDANVTVPDVDGIKIKKTTAREFTELELEEIQEALLGEKKVFIDESMLWDSSMTEAFYENWQEAPGEETEKTSEEREQETSAMPQMDAAVSEEPFSFEKLSQAAAAFLEDKEEEKLMEMGMWIAKGGAAYGGESRNRLALTKLSNWNSFYEELSMGEAGELSAIKSLSVSQLVEAFRKQYPEEWISAVVIGKEDFYTVELSEIGTDSMYGARSVNWYRSWGVEYPGEGDDNNSGVFSDQQQELMEESDRLIGKIGWDNIDRAYSRVCPVYAYNVYDGEEEIRLDGVRSRYTRVVDKIPVTATDQTGTSLYRENTEVYWPYESITLTFDEGGLVSFQWENPQIISDWKEEDVFLLPFGEIQEIFEEMIMTNLEPKGISGEIKVDEICLGYMRVDSDETEEGFGLLIPVWDFIGTVPENQAAMLGVEAQSRVSYLTINAMDGTIITRA